MSWQSSKNWRETFYKRNKSLIRRQHRADQALIKKLVRASGELEELSRTNENNQMLYKTKRDDYGFSMNMFKIIVTLTPYKQQASFSCNHNSGMGLLLILVNMKCVYTFGYEMCNTFGYSGMVCHVIFFPAVVIDISIRQGS